MDDEYQLFLEDDVRKKTEADILRRINDAIEASKERDDNIREMRDQALGLTNSPSQSDPWKGSADVDDPMTGNLELTVNAAMVQALKHSPLVMVEAVMPEDAEDAEAQEAYAQHKMYEGGLEVCMLDTIQNSNRYPVAIVACTHEERVRHVQEEVFFKPGSDVPIFEAAKEDGVYYDVGYAKVPKTEYKGLRLQTIQTDDWYMYPAIATDIQTCNGTGWRLRWSADDLINAIDDYGADEKTVWDLIKTGPTHNSQDKAYENRRERQDDIGVDEPINQRDGYYHIFPWYCKFPLLDAGGNRLAPEEYVGEDLCVLACPGAKKILKMVKSDIGPTRPLAPFNSDRESGDIYGNCITNRSDSLQAFGNAALRHTMNTWEMEISPTTKIKENLARKYTGYRYGPGRMWPVNEMGDIEPVQLPQTSGSGLQVIQWLDNKASEYIVGGNLQIQGKQRKDAEVKAQSQSIGSKMDLRLTTFCIGLEELWRIAVAILAEHMDEDGEDFLDEDGHRRHITPQQLRKRFHYIPTPNGQNSTPEAREAQAAALAGIQEKRLPLILDETKSLEFRKLMWHGAAQMAIRLGERNVKAWFGPEPQPPTPEEQTRAAQMQAPQAPPQGMPGLPPGGQNAGAINQQLSAVGAG
jgi:hypothetical protein